MTLDELRDSLPEFARDIRLNLASVLTPQGAPGLAPGQIASIALAAAISARNENLTAAIEAWAAGQLDEAGLNGARAAATIMGMNNVYYRFLHLVDDEEYARLPARLRMNVIGNPGIDRIDSSKGYTAMNVCSACGECNRSKGTQNVARFISWRRNQLRYL